MALAPTTDTCSDPNVEKPKSEQSIDENHLDLV